MGWSSGSARLGRPNALGQGHGLRGRPDPQLLGQPSAQDGVDLQRSGQVALCQVDAHEAPGGLLRERIQCQPVRERGFGRLQFEAVLLPGGESLTGGAARALPLLLLLLMPLVKGGFFGQPEAVEEGTAHQGQGVLNPGDQGGPLLLGGGRSGPPGRFPGAAAPRRGPVPAAPAGSGPAAPAPWSRWLCPAAGEASASRLRRRARALRRALRAVGRFAGGPQQGGQVTAGVHAPFDRQVEQQGFRPCARQSSGGVRHETLAAGRTRSGVLRPWHALRRGDNAGDNSWITGLTPFSTESLPC